MSKKMKLDLGRCAFPLVETTLMHVRNQNHVHPITIYNGINIMEWTTLQ